MTTEHLKRVEEAFLRAVELEGEARARYLSEIATSDPALGEQVARLLAADSTDDERLRGPVAASLARWGAEAEDPWLGRELGAYRIVRRIASGGMGTVFLAERADEQFRQRVAVKIMGVQLLAADATLRFRAERQILANLDHPYIAKLIDGGTIENGLPYLVMEYVVGLPIDRWADDHGLNVRERLKLFKKVCAAADYAHRNLIVHRDLKPNNILVDEAGNPRLLDFGIAKLLAPESAEHSVAVTREGMRAMTPEYASPEQVRGQPVSVATDVYALGVLLYRMLSGRAPYVAADALPDGLARAILDQEPSRPSAALITPTQWRDGEPSEAEISARRGTTVARLKSTLAGDLDNIVLAALRKEAEQRYASVRALVDDIDRFLEHRPVTARPPGAAYRLAKFARRHRVSLAVTAGIVAVIGLSGVQIVEERDRTAVAAVQAQQVSAFLVQLFESASPFAAKGEDITALDLLDQGTRQIEALDEQPAAQADLYRIMGQSYGALGDYDRGLALLEESLALKEASRETSSLSLADTLHQLAEVQRLRGDFASAETNLRHALTLRESELGRQDAVVARTLGRLGTLLFDRRRRDEALATLTEALEIKRALGEGEDSTAIDILGNIGITLDSLGRYDEAVAVHRQTIALSRKVDGETDPNTIIRIENLGLVFMRQGKFEEAAAQFAESLQLTERVMPADHPRLAGAAGVYAAALKRLGRFDESLARYRQALDVSAKNPGRESLAYVARLRGLGSVLLDMGQYDAADRALNEGLERAARLEGEDGYHATVLRVFLARSAIGQARYGDAESLLRRALAHADLLGASTVLLARRELAVSLSEQGRFEEAGSLFDEVIATTEQRNGADSPMLVEPLTRSAAHHLRAGEVGAALKLAERADRIGRAGMPPGNWIAAGAALEYGRALQAAGRASEARVLFEEARVDLAATFGAGDPRAVEAAALVEAAGGE